MIAGRTYLIAVALGLFLVPPLGAQEKPQYGAFYFVSDKDAMDDSNRSYTFTVSVNKTAGRTASVGWKCFRQGIRVILLLGKFYGGDSDDNIRVQYRFDTDPASQVEDWPLFSTKKIAQLPSQETEQFTERAKRATKLVIRSTDPLDSETNTDEFSLRGLSDALNHLGSCPTS